MTGIAVRRGIGLPASSGGGVAAAGAGDGVKTVVGAADGALGSNGAGVFSSLAGGTSTAAMCECGSYAAAPPNARTTSPNGTYAMPSRPKGATGSVPAVPSQEYASDPTRNTHVRPVANQRDRVAVDGGSLGEPRDHRRKRRTMTWPNSNCAGRRTRDDRAVEDNDHGRGVHACLTPFGRW